MKMKFISYAIALLAVASFVGTGTPRNFPPALHVDANIGRLEWSLEAIRECGITKEDMWFPPDSIRLSRPTVIYNTIEE